MKRKWSHRRFDVEHELRAARPEPRADFVRALVDEVRTSPEPTRSKLGRVGLAAAITGLAAVAIASFGGVGYASYTASQTAKKAERPKHAVRIVTSSAAQAQYAPFTPPKKAAAAGAKAQKPPAPPAAKQPVTTSQLPFTGLALWVPLAIGSLLIAFALLRTRGRRRGSTAQ